MTFKSTAWAVCVGYILQAAYMYQWVSKLCVFLTQPLFAAQKDEVYLNLVLDFVPETVYRVARHFNKAKSIIPIIYVKVSFFFLKQ